MANRKSVINVEPGVYRNVGKQMFIMKKKGVAHFWNGEDTACRMYSTGGITRGTHRKPLTVRNSTDGRKLCHLCATAKLKEIDP